MNFYLHLMDNRICCRQDKVGARVSVWASRSSYGAGSVVWMDKRHLLVVGLWQHGESSRSTGVGASSGGVERWSALEGEKTDVGGGVREKSQGRGRPCPDCEPYSTPVEIIFTDSPPGMRVFDVYIQEEKAISSLDIYARVGANKPLVVSGLEASVEQNELSIRFKGLIGNPVVSGTSVRKDHLRSYEEVELAKLKGILKLTDGDLTEVNHGCGEDKDLKMMQGHYTSEQKALAEAKRVIEELKRENQAKS